MEYTLVTTPSGRKTFAKLEREVKDFLLSELQVLKRNPQAGEQLKGQWRKYRCFHAKLKNVEYRVVYRIIESQQEILVYLAANRENFYKKLSHLGLK